MKTPFVKEFPKLVGLRRYGVAVLVPARNGEASHYMWLVGPMSKREAHCECLFLEDLCLYGRIRGHWSRWESRACKVSHTLTFVTEEDAEWCKQCFFQMGVHAGQYCTVALPSGCVLHFSTAHALKDAIQAQIYEETQPRMAVFNQTVIRDHDGTVVQEGDFLRVAKMFRSDGTVCRVEEISDGVAWIKYREAQPDPYPTGDAWCHIVVREQALLPQEREHWEEPEPERRPRPVMHYGHWLYFNDDEALDKAVGYLIDEVDDCAMAYDARKTGYNGSVAFCTEKRVTKVRESQIMDATSPDDSIWNKRLKEGERLPTDPFITHEESTSL